MTRLSSSATRVFGGVHVAAQVVAGAEQEAGELGKGEFGHADEQQAWENSLRLAPWGEASVTGEVYLRKRCLTRSIPNIGGHGATMEPERVFALGMHAA